MAIGVASWVGTEADDEAVGTVDAETAVATLAVALCTILITRLRSLPLLRVYGCGCWFTVVALPAAKLMICLLAMLACGKDDSACNIVRGTREWYVQISP